MKVGAAIAAILKREGVEILQGIPSIISSSSRRRSTFVRSGPNLHQHRTAAAVAQAGEGTPHHVRHFRGRDDGLRRLGDAAHLGDCVVVRRHMGNPARVAAWHH